MLNDPLLNGAPLAVPVAGGTLSLSLLFLFCESAGSRPPQVIGRSCFATQEIRVLR